MNTEKQLRELHARVLLLERIPSTPAEARARAEHRKLERDRSRAAPLALRYPRR
jgi:hypothetical protein